ncbi:hypothetical protein Tco_0059117, partial [Tanacetum coccineum]
MLKSLLSNKEKLIELANTPLNENCSTVILKKLPEKLGIARDVFVPVGKFTFLADFVIVDYESDPYQSMSWQSIDSRNPRQVLIASSPTLISIEESDLIWEEFEAYLASDSFPPGNSNPSSPLPPFHNSLSGNGFYSRRFGDENSPNNNLCATFLRCHDEHALDYSSPPLWDDYDDEFFDLNDDTYDDPFNSKEEKIKESKLLIDELDPPRSSDFLPFPECDSVFLMRIFPRLMLCPSTTNEDKVIDFTDTSFCGFVKAWSPLAASNLSHRNALGMVRDCQHGTYTTGGVGSRVDEMILARVLRGFAGEKCWMPDFEDGILVDMVVDDELFHKLMSMVEKNELFEELMIAVVDTVVDHILTPSAK